MLDPPRLFRDLALAIGGGGDGLDRKQRLGLDLNISNRRRQKPHFHGPVAAARKQRSGEYRQQFRP